MRIWQFIDNSGTQGTFAVITERHEGCELEYRITVPGGEAREGNMVFITSAEASRFFLEIARQAGCNGKFAPT